ncbi:thioesterase family protein [Vagococcus fluvialis]|uniref:thioesterase family protein n=1 Tax=Vagococcus fluvialis TaxID=2738 RepID=UPI001A8CFCF1|nr:thioesterase family protein [Vagococcus fluvialis]MBO0437097.1 thioesterase family protein [Vagococcus fluvialis]
MDIKIGTRYEKDVLVTEKNVASKFDKDLPSVFSTPDMIAEMEDTCYQLLKKIIPTELTSVGTHVNVSHEKGIVIGDTTTVTAKVIEVDRKRITFAVKAMFNDEIVGQGTHERFIIKK